MIVGTQIAVLVALMGIGIVYGTDTFCALVQRPALGRVDDAALTKVMGNVHRYGDKRMPAPGVIGLVGSAAATVLAAVSGHRVAAVTAGAALVLLIVWLVLYARISAPINRVLTAAADRGVTAPERAGPPGRLGSNHPAPRHLAGPCPVGSGRDPHPALTTSSALERFLMLFASNDPAYRAAIKPHTPGG